MKTMKLLTLLFSAALIVGACSQNQNQQQNVTQDDKCDTLQKTINTMITAFDLDTAIYRNTEIKPLAACDLNTKYWLSDYKYDFKNINKGTFDILRRSNSNLVCTCTLDSDIIYFRVRTNLFNVKYISLSRNVAPPGNFNNPVTISFAGNFKVALPRNNFLSPETVKNNRHRRLPQSGIR
jgi:hypothetical protein